MECRSCKEALTAYLDGELASGELREVDTHLNGCADCGGELESLKFAYNLTAQLPELDASADLWDRIYSGVLAPRPTSHESDSFLRRAWQKRWIPLGVVVAALLAAIPVLTPDTTGDPVTEQEFADFIRYREQISIQNRQLFNDLENHHLPAANPFIETVSYRNQNPFLQE